MRKLSVNWGNNISFMEQHVWECVGGLKGPLSSMLMYVQEIGDFIQMQTPLLAKFKHSPKKISKRSNSRIDSSSSWPNKSLKINWSLLFMNLYKNLSSAMCFNGNHGPKLIMGDFPCRSFISLKDKVQKKTVSFKKLILGNVLTFKN